MTQGDASGGHHRWREELRARREFRRRLQRRLDAAAADDPVAHALVLAAADWRDAGCGAPVPLARLRAQAERRLARVRSHQPPSDQEVQDALTWATGEPVLLARESSGRGRAGYRISAEVWPRLSHRRWDGLPAEAVLAVATPLEAVALGVRAMFLGAADRDLAVRAWEYAADSDDRDAGALAELYLADLGRDEGDPAAARERYRRVVDTGHFDAAPRAMLSLAQLELDRGDERAARTLLRDAVGSGHPCVVAQAAGLLASVRLRADDPEGAVDAYWLAAEAEDPLHSPYYGLQLGRLLLRKGDLDGAHRALVRVIDFDHPVYSVEALCEVAVMLARRGDVDDATNLLGRARDADSPLPAPELLLAEAEVHLVARKFADALALLDRLRTHPLGLEPKVEVRLDLLAARVEAGRGAEAAAARLLAALLGGEDPERREWARAFALDLANDLRSSAAAAVPDREPLLRCMVECGDRGVAAWAAYSLGSLAQRQHRWSEARGAYERAAELDRPLFGARVAVRLADVQAGEGHPERAAEAYLTLVETGPTEVVAEAATGIGRLGGALDGWPGASVKRLRDACWRRVRNGGRHTADIAFALGRVELDVVDNPYGAIDAWDVAARIDEEPLRPFVWYNLGTAYAQRHAPVSAAQAFQRALGTGHPAIAPLAALGLARQAEHHHDLPAAFDAYRRALICALETPEAAHPAAWYESVYALGRLMHACQPDDAETAYHGVIDGVGAFGDVVPGVVGAAYAHLGRLYAEQGNRALAERVWRQGRRHPDPDVSAAFAAERKSIGRIRVPRSCPSAARSGAG